jgi:2,3-dihydroxybenzoate decarboxylase
MAGKPYIIALEEHYQDAELRRQTGGPGMPGIEERLDDLGALRLREMDESGIDFQVLSHSIPGLQGVDAATGVPLARRVNDRLAETVRSHPIASPALPRCRPPVRAQPTSLERTVTKPGSRAR